MYKELHKQKFKNSCKYIVNENLEMEVQKESYKQNIKINAQWKS
jgi:hypothetical protein